MLNQTNAPAIALRAVGMHPKYTGYGYCLYIFQLTQENPDCVYRLPKTVYPLVMERFGCTRSALDRNIRFALERTWDNGNRKLLARLFDAFGTNWTPTNTEFISVMTDFILHGSSEELAREPACRGAI